jgi:thiamine-monophosphate kinase
MQGALPPSSVGELGERRIIDLVRSRLTHPPTWVKLGIGDDAAVIEPERNHLEVLTTDALVEGVHFDRRFMPADAIGHRALAVNLSDLAAMGATPRAMLLSLALPDSLPVADLEAFLDGLFSLAGRFRIVLVGGNVSRSPGPVVIDITASGSVKPRKLLSRSGARPGDEVYVSGTVGAAAAGLEQLRASSDGTALCESCVSRFLRPEPRIRLGMLLGRNRAASAAIDLSDGLADAVHQLAAASGAGISLEADAIPVEPEARRWFEARGVDPLTAAMTGGDDYELLVTVPRRRHRAFGAVQKLAGSLLLTRIGVVTSGREVVMQRGGREEEVPAGFSHFG